MTVHRVKTCGCGHPETFHAPNRGPCEYGKGHIMGGCSCLGFGSKQRNGSKVAVVHAPKVEDPLRAVLVELARGLDAMRASITAAIAIIDGREPRARKPASKLNGHAPSAPKFVVPPTELAGGAPKLKLGERKMLATLASHHPQKLTRAQLGTLVGIRGSGSTFGVYLGVLKRHALVEVVGELLGLTAAGLSCIGPSREPKMTRAEIAALWLSKLKAGERKMLDAVITEGELSRDELGDVAGIDPKGSTFTVYLGTLKRNDLVVVVGNKVRLGTALAEAS